MDLDFYGFPMRLSAQQADARARCDAVEKKVEKAWSKYAKKGRVPDEDSRKKMCRKGIPPQYRGDQWWVISGAAARAAQKGPNYYRSMVDLGRSSSADAAQIETDLPRTFPNNVWLSTREAHTVLQRVLLAYSMHNPQVGYCQGLNFLAGMLLLVLQKDEERAFWILVTLLDEGILYENMYSHNLLGAHVEMQSLAELVIEKMPALAEHFSRIHCDITIVATDWFLCLFCTTLPSETAMRIWDSLLCEGPKILYRVALALLKTNEKAILQIQDPGSVLRHLRAANASIHDRDALMTLAFDHVGSMPMAKIKDFRAEKQAFMAQELRQRSSKKNLQQSIHRHSSLNRSTSNGSGDVLPAPAPAAPQSSRGSITQALQNQNWISRKYSGAREAEPSPQRTPPPPQQSSASRVARKYSGGREYSTPPRPEPEEALFTIKDVTESARGSFAGTIVQSQQGEKVVLSPQYLG